MTQKVIEIGKQNVNKFNIAVSSENEGTVNLEIVDYAGKLTTRALINKIAMVLNGEWGKEENSPVEKRTRSKNVGRVLTHWTHDEDILLIKHLQKGGNKREVYGLISDELNRSVAAIQQRSSRLKRTGFRIEHKKVVQKRAKEITRTRWTEEENAILMANKDSMSAGEIKRKFFPNRTTQAVYARVWDIKNKKVTVKKNNKFFTKLWHEEGRPNITLKQEREK